MQTIVKMTEKEYEDTLEKLFSNDSGITFLNHDWSSSEKASFLDEVIGYNWPQVIITDSFSGVTFFSKKKLNDKITSALADVVVAADESEKGDYSIPESSIRLLGLIDA